MTLLHKIRPGDPLTAREVDQNFRVSLRQQSSTLENRDIVEGSLDTRHIAHGPHPFRQPSHHFTDDLVGVTDYATANVTHLNAQFDLFNGGAYYMVGSIRVTGHVTDDDGLAHIKIISAGSQIGYDIITSVGFDQTVTIPIMWADEWYDPSNNTSVPGTFSVEIQNTATGTPGSRNVLFSHCAIDMFVIHA